MRRGGTVGNVPNGVPQQSQVEHLSLQGVRPGTQLVAGDVGPAVLPEHARDPRERKARRLPEFDQGQFQENVGLELSPKSSRLMDRIRPTSS